MITSDIQELNISDLNEYEEDRAVILTENQGGFWRKLTLDPNKSVTGTASPFAYQDNEIVSASNVNESYVQRVSEGEAYVDTFTDFSSGIPTWGLQTSDSATYRWEPSQQQEGNGINSKIDINKIGNAVLIFQNTNQGDIRVRTYNRSNQLWSSTTTLDTLPSLYPDPDIKLSDSGIAIAVWVHDTGLGRVIQATYYDPDTLTWATAVDLSLPTATADYEPHVAINENGDGIAVWNHYQDNNTTLIQAARFDGATKTWQGFPTNITSGNESFDSRVGIDNNGNAVAIWTHSPYGTGGLTYIESSTYDPLSNTWSSPVIISFAANHATLPELSVTSNGDAMAVWIDDLGNNNYPLRANKYNGSTKTWRSIEWDITSLRSNAYPAKVSMSNFGTATIVIENPIVNVSGQYYIEAYNYDPNTDLWSTGEIITQTTNPLASPQVSMDDLGNGVAVWIQENGQDKYLESSTYLRVNKTWSLPDQISTIEVSISNPYVIAKSGVSGLNFAGASWEFIDTNGNLRITGAPATINPHIITANDSIVSFSFRKVQEVGEPEVATDAATKFYVDSAIAAAIPALMETLQKQGLLKEGALEALNKKADPAKEEKKEAKKTKKGKK